MACALCVPAYLLNAQQPLTVGPSQAAGQGVGVVHFLNWWSQVNHSVTGDTTYYSAWLPNGNIIGTENDGNGFGCGAGINIAVLKLNWAGWSNPTASTVNLVNCMASYAPSVEATSPWLWQWMTYSTGPNTSASASWKNRVPFSKGGNLYLPVERQIHTGDPTRHDAGYVKSPNGGANWCNAYNWAYRAGGPGCDSVNWKADGDAPPCGAVSSAGGFPCLDPAYTDASHSAIMWKDLPSGTENWIWINPGVQDGAAYPTPWPNDGCDPSQYTCFMLTPMDGSLARVANSDEILDISAWHYYTCPTITQTYRCPGSDPANWTTTFANRTPVLYTQETKNSFAIITAAPYSIIYIKEFGVYVMGDSSNSFIWALTAQGPWHISAKMFGPVSGSFFSFAPALGYDVLSTNPPHVQMSVATNCPPNGAACNSGGNLDGAPVMSQWDLIAGRNPATGGESFQYDNYYPGNGYYVGAAYQYSDGHVAGSLPRSKLIWGFDLADVGNTNRTDWPFFVDRGNYSVVLTPCRSVGYNVTPSGCGTVGNGSTGTHVSSTGISTNYIDTSSIGHFQVAPYEAGLNDIRSNTITPTAMQGNGSYSVMGVYQFGNSNTFHNYSAIWATGLDTGANGQSSITLNYTDNLLSLDWGPQGVAHWRIQASQTFPISTPTFIAVTVQAQTGCGTGCVPTAHLWVSIGGVLVDLFAGQSYIAVSGASSAKTPAVQAGPFAIGLGVAGTGGAGGAGSQATVTVNSFLVYSGAASSSDVQFTFNSMIAKMKARGIDIGPPSMTFDATNTQLSISYTAPNSSACTVEASESPTYSPLVHDVDTTLFAGSNQDNRDGAINVGTRRVFVLGQRLSATALDSNVYSRALQAYTRHYVRTTCGSVVYQGFGDTTNIPLNSTYQDIPQLDRSSPGDTVMPTLPASRATPFIDPHSGAQVLQVSLASDKPYNPTNNATNGPFLFFSGAPRVCGASKVGPGPGYLCKFAQGDGGPDSFYYIIPTSPPDIRYLGASFGIGTLNAVDGKFYSGGGNNVTVQTYSGTYASGSLSFSSSTLISNLTSAIVAFDATFDPTLFATCGFNAVGDFLHLGCGRGSQDSYAWVGAIRISTATVVAAVRFDDNLRTRWCAVHQIVPTGYDQPLFQIIPHAFVDGGLGQGPYLTTLTAGINSSATTIAVAGEPACSTCGTDPGVALARVGDVFQIGSEYVQIVTKTSSTSWMVTRGARSSTPASHSSADNVTGSCNGTQIFWKFLNDPHGTDTTNTNFVQDFAWSAVSGHDDATTDQLLSEAGDGWVVRAGNLMTQVGQPYTALIPSQFSFAGKNANCFGNACRKHPAVGQPGSAWFGDFPDWDFVGTGNGADTLVNITGSLYKVTAAMPVISPKHYAIAAAIGAESSNSTYPLHSILDVSPAVIGGTSADNYKLCIANASNECFSGAVKGDIYVNVPALPGLKCDSGHHLCIANFSRYANGAAQIGVDGTSGRILASLPLRKTNDYPTYKTLADGSYMLYAIGSAAAAEHWDAPSNVLMTKLPPFTAPDALDRSTFIRAPISITTPTGLGIATATVQFGYLEQGTMNQHYCTSRSEACVVVSATVTDATPYSFETTDSYTRASCASSCTITLPVLPSHTAYWRVAFYDGSGNFVQYGASGVATENIVR